MGEDSNNTKTRITIWMEKDKPTKVKTTKSEVFYLADDLAQMSLREIAEYIATQKKIGNPKK